MLWQWTVCAQQLSDLIPRKPLTSSKTVGHGRPAMASDMQAKHTLTSEKEKPSPVVWRKNNYAAVLLAPQKIMQDRSSSYERDDEK